MNKNNLPLDANGFPFENQTFWLSATEYSKIYSEINLIYDAQYKNKKIATHTSFGIDGMTYVYWFENHGFNNYNIYLRVVDNH